MKVITPAAHSQLPGSRHQRAITSVTRQAAGDRSVVTSYDSGLSTQLKTSAGITRTRAASLRLCGSNAKYLIGEAEAGHCRGPKQSNHDHNNYIKKMVRVLLCVCPCCRCFLPAMQLSGAIASRDADAFAHTRALKKKTFNLLAGKARGRRRQCDTPLAPRSHTTL